MIFRDDDWAEAAFAPRSGALPPESRRINWRWLAACTLIGLSGAGLLGSALHVSRPFSPRRPLRASPSRPGTPGENRASRKADSLLKQSFTVSTAQHFRAPLTETAGGKEIIKIHAVAHVSVGLSPAPVTDIDIPALDTVPPAASPDVGGQTDAMDPAEADVSITRRDLAEATIGEAGPTLSDEAVTAQVAELARLAPDTPQLPPGFSDQRILSRTLRLSAELDDVQNTGAGSGRFGSLDVRVVPENLTSVAPDGDGALRFDEVDLMLGHRGTLASLLAAQGASAQRIEAIVDALGRRRAAELPEGQHLRLTVGPSATGRAIQRVTLFDESGPQQIVAENDKGGFASLGRSGAAPAEDAPRKAKAEAEEEDDSATVYQSAYAGALRSEVPRAVIEEAMHALEPATDLRQAAAAGDRLELIYTEDETAGGGNQHVLLLAALTAGGETQALYPFASADGASREFLDENGVSPIKLLMRKPVQVGRISSPFGMRYHPILHYSRLHNGVDWASQRGTPIMAAGDGTVVAAGARSGYGNRVEIEHANGYASAYNHMASIGRGIAPGAHVHMGDIIGQVGTTGLSTGPHVHYEVTANGHFVDPMKVRLPSRRALSDASLAAFQARRTQIDDLRRHGGSTAIAAGGGRS